MNSKPHAHSPMKPLYQEYKSKRTGEVVRRNLVGYQCQCGCTRIYTTNGTLSEPERMENKHGWIPRWFPNKKHQRRVNASK